MAKKQKTIKKQARNLGIAKRTLFGLEFVSALTPMFVYVLVNDSQYFVEYEGMKYSFALFIAMALVSITIIGVSGDKIKGSLLTFILKIGCALAIVMLIREIIFEIENLLKCLFFGLLGSFGFEIGYKAVDKTYKDKKESIKLAKQQNDIAQAREELEK